MVSLGTRKHTARSKSGFSKFVLSGTELCAKCFLSCPKSPKLPVFSNTVSPQKAQTNRTVKSRTFSMTVSTSVSRVCRISYSVFSISSSYTDFCSTFPSVSILLLPLLGFSCSLLLLDACPFCSGCSGSTRSGVFASPSSLHCSSDSSAERVGESLVWDLARLRPLVGWRRGISAGYTTCRIFSAHRVNWQSAGNSTSVNWQSARNSTNVNWQSAGNSTSVNWQSTGNSTSAVRDKLTTKSSAQIYTVGAMSFVGESPGIPPKPWKPSKICRSACRVNH